MTLFANLLQVLLSLHTFGDRIIVKQTHEGKLMNLKLTLLYPLFLLYLLGSSLEAQKPSTEVSQEKIQELISKLDAKKFGQFTSPPNQVQLIQ